MNSLTQKFKKLFFPNSIGVSGYVDLKCYDKEGNLKWHWEGKNGITNAGFAALAGLAGNTGAVSAFTYLAVGSSNTAFSAAQTALQSEISTSGLARAAATVSRVTTTQTNDTLQLTYTWTASGSVTVEEIGVFNASSSGVMLGRALTGTKSLSNTDLLVGTYKVKFS